MYADNGIFGGDIRRRAEFKRLVEDCDAGKIDIILCKSISRFARNTVDFLETVRQVQLRHDLPLSETLGKADIYV